ncbi:uncharacterized protein LOC100844641 isoform X2 [Brachypodium distachyon]|uniref:uncharacterized protein LOC100844641 isoform X2 n=1 Tax=Brachypodium distachyon TaxID=15368 RepID=UPI000D0D59D4|nr:uncharacterized protein LOC100844641 isoform X2 [Brachypodium distachyon]|eukprot:XP_024311716.1 uncharacterized protein LOC100844641 isoform X2 [Brachypodium distachyon]
MLQKMGKFGQVLSTQIFSLLPIMVLGIQIMGMLLEMLLAQLWYISRRCGYFPSSHHIAERGGCDGGPLPLRPQEVLGHQQYHHGQGPRRCPDQHCTSELSVSGFLEGLKIGWMHVHLYQKKNVHMLHDQDSMLELHKFKRHFSVHVFRPSFVLVRS